MRRLLVPVLVLNALLLAVRVLQEIPVVQGGGGSPATDERFCADSNGDGVVDLSDAVTILSYLFTGLGGEPYCVAQGVGLDQFATREDLEGLRAELLAEVAARPGPHRDRGGAAPAVERAGATGISSCVSYVAFLEEFS